MLRIIFRFALVVCVFTFANTLKADTLLGSDTVTITGISLGGANPGLTSIQLWFEPCHSQLPPGEVSCVGPPLGTALNISPSSTTQTFVLNASNDPNFGIIAAGVESGNEPLAQLTAEIGLAGSGVDGFTSFNLPGASIDSFVYVVSPFQIVHTADSIVMTGFTVEVDAYGESASQVPEPSSSSLLGAVVALLAFRKIRLHSGFLHILH